VGISISPGLGHISRMQNFTEISGAEKGTRKPGVSANHIAVKRFEWVDLKKRGIMKREMKSKPHQNEGSCTRTREGGREWVNKDCLS